MAITATINGQKRIAKATGIYFTKYDENGRLGDETLNVHAVVGDTLSINQDEATETEKAHEFSDNPLDTSVKLGKLNLSMDCIDFQNAIMKELYGFEEVNGVLVAPAGYKELNCFVRVTFDNLQIILPKVKLNSQLALGTMRSDMATGTIKGTCVEAAIGIADAVEAGGTMPTSIPDTNKTKGTLVFLPTGKDVFVETAAGGWITGEQE